MSDQMQWYLGAVRCILKKQLGLRDGTQEKKLGDCSGKLQNSPLMISSPYVWARPGDSLLTDRIWQKWWDALLLLGYKRLRFPSCSYSHQLFSHTCSGGGSHTAEKGRWPLANSQQRTYTLRLTAHEEPNPTKKHQVALGADSAPGKLEMLRLQPTLWLQPVRDPEA